MDDFFFGNWEEMTFWEKYWAYVFWFTLMIFSFFVCFFCVVFSFFRRTPNRSGRRQKPKHLKG